MKTNKYIINPETGRKVLTGGRIGKHILKGGVRRITGDAFVRMANGEGSGQLPRLSQQGRLRNIQIHVDDHGTYMDTGAHIYGADLSRLNLDKMTITGYRLAHDIETVFIKNTQFEQTGLKICDLQYVTFNNCNFNGAQFHGSTFGSNVVFNKCTLVQTVLENVKAAPHGDAEELVFDTCNLTETNFVGANLTKAQFITSSITGADFKGANLTDAKLTRSDLRGADFKYATLKNTDFTGSDLRGADFRNSIWEQTVFPLDLRGNIFSDDQKTLLRGLGFTV